MNFSSDTSAPAHPAVLEALAKANTGMASSYGADEGTARVKALLQETFEADLEVLLVSSGTAANALALALLCPPTGAIACHEEAHIERDERGAPEFYTGGGKLRLLTGEHARIDPQALEAALAANQPDFVHETPLAALSITNLTESGAAYPVEDVRRLCGMAKGHRLGVHLDGARFANVVAASGATPAEQSSKSGVDILTLGFTKTGAMACEAIILFGDSRDRYSELLARAKRAGHLTAKMRYLAAQASALLEDGLMFELAETANAAARDLADILIARFDAGLAHPVDGNEVFVHLPPAAETRLRDAGLAFYPWIDGSSRFVCNWTMTEPHKLV